VLDPLMKRRKEPDLAAWLGVTALVIVVAAIVLLSVVMASW
jgi:hypothetical protein